MQEKQTNSYKILSNKLRQLNRIKRCCDSIILGHWSPCLINSLLLSVLIPVTVLFGIYLCGLERFMPVAYCLSLVAYVLLFWYFYHIKPISLTWDEELDLHLSEYEPVELDAFLELQNKLLAGADLTADDVCEWQEFERKIIEKKLNTLQVTQKFISRKIN